MLAEQAIGEHAAEHGCEIDEPGVEAVDVRGEGLHTERSEHGLEKRLERREPDHVLGVPGQQKQLHHIKDEQRAHSVIGEALPHLGGE